MTYRKKLLEVALPLEAINEASAREKSLRQSHPMTIHLWWARRPLVACRAVIFGQLVDDPSAWPDQYRTADDQDRERKRLFGLITDLVQWENSNNEKIVNAARLEIARSVARNRKAEGTASGQDEAVLRMPPSYLADGRYRDLGKTDVATVNRYLAEEAPPVHDPFAGGGSIPVEAQRLGLRAIATDLNPVPVLLNKALIEIPAKFSGMPPVNPESRRRTGMQSWMGAQGLAEDVRYYGKWMRDETTKRIGNLYPKVELPSEHGGGKATVIAWLWARTVASPNPACNGAHVPLVSSFWLSTKTGKETWIEPVIKGGNYSFTVRQGKPEDSDAVGRGTTAGKRNAFICLLSGTPIDYDYIRREGKAGKLGVRLMALVAEGKRQRIYLPPTEEMEATAKAASPSWIPEQSLPDNPRDFKTPNYGLTTFGDLFTRRQLVALTTLSDLVREARSNATKSAELKIPGDSSFSESYGDAIAVYLGILVSNLTDLNNALTRWKADRGCPVNLFARQAIPMVWDFAESNVLSESAGSLESALDNLVRRIQAFSWSASAVGGEASQQNAAESPVTLERIISTDPPYYDNIGYADLSDFFYVWLRRTLHFVYPSLFGTMLVPKADELVATPYRHGSKETAEEFFMTGMCQAIRNMAASTVVSSPVAIFYAFKQTEEDNGETTSTGWETFLSAVFRSGFGVSGTWPIRTELENRMIGMGNNALASSIVLVCRKRPDDAPTIDRTTFRRLLRQELPAALRHLQKGNIAPVDMAQASIGPGMAIYSRHSKVLEADGSAMSVRTALQLINQALDEYLTEQEGEFDADTRFAVTWFETRAFEAGAFGEAETLAKARNVAVSGVAEAGILYSAGGKVRLLRRDELPDDWDPAQDKRLTVWEATQHLIKRLETRGETGAAELMAVLGPKAAPARDLAYRLYTTCERKKWAEEARAYNGLVVSWPEIEKLAAQTKSTEGPAQGQLL